MMNKRLAVSLVAASLLASGSAFAQSTTAAGAANGARAGGDIAGPVGAADQGWLSLSRSNSTHLYQMDLKTAALTDLGTIGDGTRKFGELTVSVDAPAPQPQDGELFPDTAGTPKKSAPRAKQDLTADFESWWLQYRARLAAVPRA